MGKLTKARRLSNKFLITAFVVVSLAGIVLWALFYWNVIPYNTCIGVWDGNPHHCDVLLYSGFWNVLNWTLPVLLFTDTMIFSTILYRVIVGELGKGKKGKK